LIDADPDPACNFNTDPDPDPAFLFDADLDLAFHFDANPAQNIEKVLKEAHFFIHYGLSPAN
jgi:hypothetical protein